MSYGIKVEVWGERALFTRPELSVERVSYPVITPSAARGILDAIYWHPGMQYVIDRIHVLNEIQFTNIRRNEVKSKAPVSAFRTAITKGGELPYLATRDEIQQRSSMMLRNVHYVIEAHFEMTSNAGPQDNPGKFSDIIRRRLEKGSCYYQPYLGTRECSCHFRAWSPDKDPQGFYTGKGEHDFGIMLYDMDYTNKGDIEPMYYWCIMHDGIIQVSESEVLR